MRALVVAVVAGALLAGGVSAEAAPSKAKVKCRWVKATKKRKRHKVCVKVKAKAKATPAPATPPVAPPAPSAPAPTTDALPAPAPTAEAPLDPGPAPAPARLQATTREWSITLSRPTLVAGPAILQLVNRGEDAHDLHLRPAAGGADLLAVAGTDPGGVVDVSGTLAAGTYTLYCSLPGHEAAGMHATLIVQ